MAVFSKIVGVYPNTNYDVRGISRSIIISCGYLDEPPFTDEQIKTLHEIAESFIMTNRQRARNRRKSEYAKNRRKEKNNEN